MILTLEEHREIWRSVERGVAWMDENARPGWRDRISIASLAMQDGCACICGQVFADEALAAHARGRGFCHAPQGFMYVMHVMPGETSRSWNWAVDHGFAAPEPPRAITDAAEETEEGLSVYNEWVADAWLSLEVSWIMELGYLPLLAAAEASSWVPPLPVTEATLIPA